MRLLAGVRHGVLSGATFEQYGLRQAVFGLAVIVAALSSTQAQAQPQDQDGPKAFVVMGSANLPPYQFRDDEGNLVGANIDLLRNIADRLGRKLVYQPTPWAEAQSRLISGEGDALSLMAKTPEREIVYRFSDPTFRIKLALFQPSAVDVDLRTEGIRVGVIDKSFGAAFIATNYPTAQLVPMENTRDVLQALNRKAVDAAVTLRAPGVFVLNEFGLKNITVAENPLAIRPVHIALRQGNDAMVSDINVAIAGLIEDGIMDEIVDQWLADQVFLLSRRDVLSWVGALAIGTGAAFFLILAISRRMTIVNERRRATDMMALSNFAIDHAGEGILWISENGKIINANATAAEITGYADFQLIGQRVTQLFVHDNLDALKQAWLTTSEDKQATVEDTMIRADNRSMAVEIFANSVAWGDETYLCAFLMDATEKKQTRGELHLRTRALEALGDGVIISDAKSPENPIIYVNPAFEQITGYHANEVIGKNCRFMQGDDTEQVELEKLRQGISKLRPCSATIRNYRKDGTLFWNNLSIWPVRDETGEVSHFIGIQRDITKQKNTEDTLRLAATVFETTAEAIMVSDADNRIKAINPAFKAITGYSEADVLGKDPSLLGSGRQDDAFYKAMWSDLKNDGRWSGEIWNRRKNGEVYPEWLSVTVIKNNRDEVVEYVAVFSDISKKVEAEEQIRWQANYDALTELPNRNLFFDRLSRSISSAKRNHRMVALLFIDLDRFKVVNDTLGHHVGDNLLRAATARLQLCIRESDTLARFGGDEFTVVLPQIEHVDDAAIVAEKIIAALSEPFELDDQRAFIGASIGITIYPNDADDPATMLRNADVAMYRAKNSGRNAYRFFTAEMDQQALHRMNMENDIRHGIEQGHFVTFFQPIIDCESGLVTSAEVLVRWNHPDRGMLMPGDFIELAEETGLINPLGAFVRREALRQAKLWPDDIFEQVDLSINLSGRELAMGFSREELAALLDEMEFPAERMTLEITENVILEETNETTLRLREIRAMGVKFSVDDFGTGYSSLSYLKRFPLDVVKIDRSFIRDIITDHGDASLVEAVVSMARSLDLEVVAEGVENTEQFEYLQNLRCAKAQGYLFSHPVSGPHFPDIVRTINANEYQHKVPEHH